MKRNVRNFAMAMLGGLCGNVIYVHTLGDPANYHWGRSLVFSCFMATTLVALQIYRQRSS